MFPFPSYLISLTRPPPVLLLLPAPPLRSLFPLPCTREIPTCRSAGARPLSGPAWQPSNSCPAFASVAYAHPAAGVTTVAILSCACCLFSLSIGGRVSSFTHSGTSPLSVTCIANIFSLPVVCIFSSLMVFFTSRKNLFTTDFWGVRPFCVLRNLCLPVFLLKACSLRDFIQNENSSPNRGPKPHRTGSQALLDLTSRYPPCTPSAPSALAALLPQQACSGLRAFALLPFPYILLPQLLPGQLPHLLQASAPLSILLSPILTTFPATAGSPSLPALDILALPDLFLTAPSTCILSLGVSTRQ